MAAQKDKNQIYFIPEGSPVAPDKYDVRVRNRHITGGVVTFEGLKSYLTSLPDDTEFAEFRSYDVIVNDDTVEPTETVVAGAPEGGTQSH